MTLNGQPAALGSQVAPGDEVRVDGDSIGVKKQQVYIALNKPVGIICTTEAHIEDNIIDHVGFAERIFPVGRLDRDSEGLILLTNNGDIVNEILRSENNHEKEYLVSVDRPITDLSLRMLADGVKIMGELTKAQQGRALECTVVSNHSHPRLKPPNPPHVFGAGLQSTASAARAHHEYSSGEFAARPMASSDSSGTERLAQLGKLCTGRCRAINMSVGSFKIIERYPIVGAASRLGLLLGAFPISLSSSGATPLRRQQSASQQVQVGERKAGVQAGGVLHQPAITYLVEPPESFDHVKGMLNAGSRGRSASIDPALILAQRSLIRSPIDAVANALPQSHLAIRGVPIGLVAKHFALRTVQQFEHLRAVGHIRRRRAQAVHDSAPVRANVRFHAKMPVLSFLRLTHFRIPASLLVLGRGRRGNDGCIHNRAGLQQQPLLLEQATDLCKYLLRQFVLLQKMAKAQNRRFVRYVMPKQFNARKAALSIRCRTGSLRLADPRD